MFRADSSFTLGEPVATLSAATRRSLLSQVRAGSRGFLFFNLGEPLLATPNAATRTSPNDQVSASSRGLFSHLWKTPLRLAPRSRRSSSWISVRADSSFILGRADGNSDCGKTETVPQRSSREFAGHPLLQLARNGCDPRRDRVGGRLGSEFARDRADSYFRSRVRS